MKIKEINDVNVRIIPLYDKNDNIVEINEVAGGTKSYDMIHNFEISDTKYVHKIADQNRTISYAVKDNKIISRATNFEENMSFFYEGDLLKKVEYQNHPDNTMYEELIWLEDRLTKILIYDSEQLIESREIETLDIPNFWNTIPLELQLIMFDKLGYSYFFSKHLYQSFTKIYLANNEHNIFSRYDFSFKFDNGNLLLMERKGSLGAKDFSNVEVFYEPA